MVEEVELQAAIAAGERFLPTVLEARYDAIHDRVALVTHWGALIVNRKDVPDFRDVNPSAMEGIYASHTGIHIDDVDLDINSAGLLSALLHELKGRLANSF